MRCRRCSKKGHLTKECDVVCKNCWDPHHIFLCPKISEPLAAKSSGGSAKSGKSSDKGEKGKRETWAWTCLSSSNDFQPSAANILDHGKGTLRPTSSAGSTRRGGGAFVLHHALRSVRTRLGLNWIQESKVCVFGGGVEQQTMHKVRLMFLKSMFSYLVTL